MNSVYSVIIRPNESVIVLVRKWKEELRKSIGRNYAGCHSEAHVSITNFVCNEQGLGYWENYIQSFCKVNSSFDMRFNRWGFYPQHKRGVVCLLPDQQSSMTLVPLMKLFNKNAPLSNPGATHQPHISIGRELSDDEVAKAEGLWSNKDLDIVFPADGLTIRKFDPQRLQYTFYKTVLFNANPQISLL